MKTKNSIRNFVLLSVGIIIALNILSNRFFARLDFTADQRYTLSKATKDILSNLTEPVTITAYFSENLPPDVAKTRKDFKELLVEYDQRSNGMVVYEFINPNENEELEKKAMQAGIQPVMINVREKDQMKQQKAYLGAVIQLGEKRESIPFMQPGAAMEYALSSGIKKLSVNEKNTIGFVHGHGEPSISEMQQADNSLSVLYQTEELTLNDTAPIPPNFKTIALVNPTDSFPEGHLLQLDEFLARGGNLFIAYNRVKGDLSTAQGQTSETGLESWLSRKGINMESNFIVDASCGSVTVRQQQGMFNFQNNIAFPYFPLINSFVNHPAVKGLESIMFQFASPISFSGDTSIKFTPIAKTSAKTGTQPAPTYFNIQKQWNQNDFPMEGLTVAAVVTGKLSGNADSKMIIISNGNFAINGEGQRAMQLPPDNVNLLVNGVDWLSDETGLIELRTKGVSTRPLDQMEDSTKTMLKYLNFLLPVILIVIYGFIRVQMKNNQKVKRMQEDFS